jgi:hypothetical protein
MMSTSDASKIHPLELRLPGAIRFDSIDSVHVSVYDTLHCTCTILVSFIMNESQSCYSRDGVDIQNPFEARGNHALLVDTE